MNRSEAFWGPNAKEFEPERWLVDSDIPAKEISGHRHLLTFSDGPRLCLGRGFALAEFKVSDKHGFKFVPQRHYLISRQHFRSSFETIRLSYQKAL